MKRLKTSILLSLAILSSIQLVAQAPEKEAVLSLEAFEQKLNRSPQPQILDVRSPEEYAENHLIGAINLNLADEAAFKKGVETLDKQKPVFVYSINNGRSGLVAKQLRGQGFIEVYDLPGGLAR